MKIVVIGGSGLIGSKVVAMLAERGHEVIAASPKSGVNAVTGEGLAGALKGAQVVVDVANSPSFETEAAMSFFERAGRNLRDTEKAAGVKHHVALSVVGTERLLESGYFRAKLAQEELVKRSGVPYTIVRATQFFEFMGAIADSATVGDIVRLPPAMMQPMSAHDVAAALTEVALSTPANDTVEIAGPEPIEITEIVRWLLAERADHREVVTDNTAKYFGISPQRESLMPGKHARTAPTRFAAWLEHNAPSPHTTAR